MHADHWKPAAGVDALRRRARLLADVRAFFAARGVLEVETPLLGAATATDVHIASLRTRCDGAGGGHHLYLQTSPESAMKRLLAAGSGPIFQICKAFRDGEQGRAHNPEFTLLEWYRPGFDHHALMDEVEALLAAVAGTGAAVRLTYRDAMRRHAGVDPFGADVGALAGRARELGLAPPSGLDRDGLLDLLIARAVQPRLGEGLSVIHDYPSSQAALARVRDDAPPVAERFEFFLDGVELANGYNELRDPVEQRRRMEADMGERERRGLAPVPVDERLLGALSEGLPECAGVALGLDRLLMRMVGAQHIGEVLAFPLDRA